MLYAWTFSFDCISRWFFPRRLLAIHRHPRQVTPPSADPWTWMLHARSWLSLCPMSASTTYMAHACGRVRHLDCASRACTHTSLPIICQPLVKGGQHRDTSQLELRYMSLAKSHRPVKRDDSYGHRNASVDKACPTQKMTGLCSFWGLDLQACVRGWPRRSDFWVWIVWRKARYP